MLGLKNKVLREGRFGALGTPGDNSHEEPGTDWVVGGYLFVKSDSKG